MMKALSTVLLALVLAGCSVHIRKTPEQAQLRTEIVAALEESAAGWNQGDLESFLAPYSDSTTFVGSGGLVRGKEQLRGMYSRSYWRGGARPTQTLRFEDIEVRPLGTDHALAVGRYVLTGGERPQSGWFSLTWARTPTGWRIVHDHSS